MGVRRRTDNGSEEGGRECLREGANGKRGIE